MNKVVYTYHFLPAMTTNIWINDLMKDIPSFIGVYSTDTVIEPNFFPCYMIVNFSKSVDPGTHFVSILFINSNTCWYFDPLNLSFIPQEIRSYMFQNSRNVRKIKFKIQNSLSVFCGFFCLVPILLHVNNFPILRGLSIFTPDLIENDDICIDLLTHLFKIYYITR